MLYRVSECHGTVRGNCNLQGQVACAADALNPGNDNDMIRFLLNLYAIIKAGTDTKGLRQFWPVTFDEDTYTRARKIIYYVFIVAPKSGLFDSMGLPDFDIFLLSPEFWHVSHVVLRNSAFGPKLGKGEHWDDGRRFFYRNFMRPMLVVMRQRGTLSKEMFEALQADGVTVAHDEQKELSVQKEKMSAEYKDCHLYLTYLRIGFQKFAEQYPDEYSEASSNKDNYDVVSIFNVLQSRLPLALDFAEHLHHKNLDVLEYMLARIVMCLDTEGRTKYRRCLTQFLQDLEALSSRLRRLLLEMFRLRVPRPRPSDYTS